MKRLIFCMLVLSGCHSSIKDNGLEDGYYIVSKDKTMTFFCTNYYVNHGGVEGVNCVDMTCMFIGDGRGRSKIFLKEAVVYKTQDFNYKNVCNRQ